MSEHESEHRDQTITRIALSLTRALRELAKARRQLPYALRHREWAEIEFGDIKALAEARIEEDAGGPKGLGPNQDARDRAIAIALLDSESYTAANENMLATRFEWRMAEAEVAVWRDTVDILKVALMSEIERHGSWGDEDIWEILLSLIKKGDKDESSN